MCLGYSAYSHSRLIIEHQLIGLLVLFNQVSGDECAYTCISGYHAIGKHICQRYEAAQTVLLLLMLPSTLHDHFNAFTAVLQMLGRSTSTIRDVHRLGVTHAVFFFVYVTKISCFMVSTHTITRSSSTILFSVDGVFDYATMSMPSTLKYDSLPQTPK